MTIRPLVQLKKKESNSKGNFWESVRAFIVSMLEIQSRSELLMKTGFPVQSLGFHSWAWIPSSLIISSRSCQ